MSRITIVKNDNQVGIDGVFLPVDCSDLPQNFHALQWIDTEGEVEWNGKPKPQNTEITSLKPYQKYIDRWNEVKHMLEMEAELEDELILAAQQESANTSNTANNN